MEKSLFDSFPSVEKMNDVFANIENKALSVLLNPDYLNMESLYWNRGCGRRLRALIRSLSNVFTILPYKEIQEYEELDAGAVEDINIQFNSFVVNYHGYLDNVAFVIENCLPPKYRHEDSRYVSIKSIKWNDAKGFYPGLKECIKDFLEKKEDNQSIRNRSTHRLFPYYLPVFDSDEDYNNYLKYRKLSHNALESYDFEKYHYYSDMSEKMIHYHGNMMSDIYESDGKPFFIKSIHCFMIEELNDLLDFTTKVFEILKGYEFIDSHALNPELINYNWSKE